MDVVARGGWKERVKQNDKNTHTALSVGERRVCVGRPSLSPHPLDKPPHRATASTMPPPAAPALAPPATDAAAADVARAHHAAFCFASLAAHYEGGAPSEPDFDEAHW